MFTQIRRRSFKVSKELEAAKLHAEAAAMAKSAFLATMSHEVRTPLTGILSMLMLLEDTPLSAEQRDYIGTARISSESLLVILNDILDFSKIEAGKVEIQSVELSVGGLVDSVVSFMRARAREKNLALSYQIDDGTPSHVLGDPVRLREILLNLIGNAIKFTHAGSVLVRVSLAGPRLRFAVQDTGIGFSREAQQRLFQDFSQADSSIAHRFGGTGLGLSICRKLVELMQGSIGASSQEGAGSTFWFDIPAVAASASTLALPSVFPGPNEPVLGPLTLLVAEDNRINQKVIGALLGRRWGHTVTFVENGSAAIEALTRDGACFDAVLMDMQMPVMDGLATARAIRALPGPLRDIPVIALTAGAAKDEERDCLDAGMNAFVAKPIDPALLIRALARCVPSAVKVDVSGKGRI